MSETKEQAGPIDGYPSAELCDSIAGKVIDLLQAHGNMKGSQVRSLWVPWIGRLVRNELSSRSVPCSEKIDALERALRLCLHVIEKGIEVRMMDQWPALKRPLAEAKSSAVEALHHSPITTT